MLTSSVRVFIVFFIVAIGGGRYAAPAFPPDLDYPPLEISQSVNSWTARTTVEDGAILFSETPQQIQPMPNQNILLVIEQFANPGSMVFIQDYHRLSAYSLSSGQKLFSTYLFYNEFPFIPEKIFAWGDRTVVYGFYQEEASVVDGYAVIEYLVYIFDLQGKSIASFTTFDRPIGVDAPRNALYSFHKVGLTDANEIFIQSLPNGDRLPEINVGKWAFSHTMTFNERGDLFLIRRNTGNESSGEIEKYSLSPWARIWTKTIAPNIGYPNYLNYEMGKLWYGVYYPDVNTRPDELESAQQWDGGPLDPVTGEAMESEERFDPTRVLHEYGGNRYRIERLDERSIRVHATPSNSHVRNWEMDLRR